MKPSYRTIELPATARRSRVGEGSNPQTHTAICFSCLTHSPCSGNIAFERPCWVATSKTVAEIYDLSNSPELHEAILLRHRSSLVPTDAPHATRWGGEGVFVRAIPIRGELTDCNSSDDGRKPAIPVKSRGLGLIHIKGPVIPGACWGGFQPEGEIRRVAIEYAIYLAGGAQIFGLTNPTGRVRSAVVFAIIPDAAVRLSPLL
jgi:hypothetical protein